MTDAADIVRDALSWIHTHPSLSMEFQQEAEKTLSSPWWSTPAPWNAPSRKVTA